MMKKRITANNLVEEFCKEYESKNGKFLLFDLANANENANTRMLKHLLSYNNCQFLNSFLKRIGLPLPGGSVTITDQLKAIGPKKTGYIDLYINYDDVHVIIENKIYGAVDTKQQLARYIATVNNVDKKDFDGWHKKPKINVKTYLVYLTLDKTKEPSEDSLPSNLKNLIEYYPICYNDDILPWLEEEVLPTIPYGEDGLMIAGLRQYIAYLEQMLTKESSEVIDEFVQGLKGADTDKYKELLSFKIEKDEFFMKSLRKQLDSCAEAIFSKYENDEGWILHFTPSYFILYKKTWAALDSRKYIVPSIYLCGSSTEEFLKNGKIKRFALGIDHLSVGFTNDFPQNKCPNVVYVNHGKTAGFNLTEKVDNLKCKDVNDLKSRNEYFDFLIDAVKDTIKIIDDKVTRLMGAKQRPAKPQEVIFNEYVNQNVGQCKK